MDKWNLDDPIQAQAALDYYFSLPDNEVNSDEEGDEGASDELEELDELPLNSSGSNTPKLQSIVHQYENKTRDELYQQRPPLEVEPSPKDELSITQTETEPIPLSDQNNSSDEEEDWNNNTDDFDNLYINFYDNVPSSNYNFNKKSKEIDYFLKIFTEEMFSSIVEQTNLYAFQIVSRRSNKKEEPGPSKNWSDTTNEEIKALFGMMILMGIHNMPRLANYWATDPYLSVPCVAQVMNSKRYKKLIENFHLNDNTKAVERDKEGYDKLYKVRPLVDSLQKTICTSYNHYSVFAVDESMIPFKGRCFIKQFMPNKPIKWGYKVWCFADSMTGYIYNFDIYVGKSEANSGPELLGERVVLQLTSQIKSKDCLVVFDNFFTTYSLVKKLKSKQIYSIVTVRVNRKGLPPLMKTKPKLSRGEFMFSGYRYSGCKMEG